MPAPDAPGSEAAIPVAVVEAAAPSAVDEAAGTGGAVVHYHFPVEIEVRAAPEAADPTDAARLALRWLTDGLHSV
jgi:hypothetical protein